MAQTNQRTLDLNLAKFSGRFRILDHDLSCHGSARQQNAVQLGEVLREAWRDEYAAGLEQIERKVRAAHVGSGRSDHRLPRALVSQASLSLGSGGDELGMRHRHFG